MIATRPSVNCPTRTIIYQGSALISRYDMGPCITENRIPAISLAQPWASWVAMGWKTIETRNHRRFACLVGRRIAIHASKSWDYSCMAMAEEFMSAEQFIQHCRMAAKRGKSDGYPMGELVAVATMLGIRDCTHPELATAALCNYEGRVGYVLGDVSPLPAGLKVSGALGIFYVSLPVTWLEVI
jgi:hypothetical protein